MFTKKGEKIHKCSNRSERLTPKVSAHKVCPQTIGHAQGPGSICRDISAIWKINLVSVFPSKILRWISSKNSAYQARAQVVSSLDAQNDESTMLQNSCKI